MGYGSNNSYSNLPSLTALALLYSSIGSAAVAAHRVWLDCRRESKFIDVLYANNILM